MPAIEENILKKQIREQDFQRVYLIYGEESYLVEQYSDRMIQKLVSGEMADFNLQRFDGKTSADAILDAVEELPVFSDRKCVVVTDLDADSYPAADMTKLLDLLGDLPESCVLIFREISVTVNAKRSAKWKKFLQAVEKSGCSVEFKRREVGDLVKYLVDLAGKRGVQCSPDCARYLTRVCGLDLNTLNNEMEKLCAFAQDRGEITREDVDLVAVRTTEAATFRLANALMAGEYDRAFGILDDLFYQREEPVTILAALSSAYTDLYRAKAAVESGVTISQAAQDFEYRNLEFKLKNAARAGSRMKLSSIRRCLSCIYQADTQMKGSRMDNRTLLEKLMAELLLISVKG